MAKPRLFSTFMLWMLAQLYQSLPEAGDLPKPKLAFFFDEAHLLFTDASDALMQQVELDGPAHPLQGRRRLLRDPGAHRRAAVRAGPAGQPGPARAARLHARRTPTTCARPRARSPSPTHYDVEETHHLAGHRRGAGHGPVAAGRADAARRDPAAATRLADGRHPARGVPGPRRGGHAGREVRHDHRPRERPRDHLASAGGGPCAAAAAAGVEPAVAATMTAAELRKAQKDREADRGTCPARGAQGAAAAGARGAEGGRAGATGAAQGAAADGARGAGRPRARRSGRWRGRRRVGGGDGRGASRPTRPRASSGPCSGRCSASSQRLSLVAMQPKRSEICSAPPPWCCSWCPLIVVIVFFAVPPDGAPTLQ